MIYHQSLTVRFTNKREAQRWANKARKIWEVAWVGEVQSPPRSRGIHYVELQFKGALSLLGLDAL